MSNNPFRNRIGGQVSPATSPRPVSNNPFLDTTELITMSNGGSNNAIPNGSVEKTADTFVWLTMKQLSTWLMIDQGTMNISEPQNELQQTRSRQANAGPRRPDHPSLRGFPQPPGHRPSASEEERRRQRVREELDIFADPVELKIKDRSRRPRRNSESSVREKPAMDPEEERKRRERKYRESKRSGSKSTKPNKKLDVIDKLDVTSIYGTGCEY